MEETYNIIFSSKCFLMINISFLTNILHLTSERKMKGRKAMFIQGSWAVVWEWVPDAVALKTPASMEGLCLSWYKKLRRINFLSKPNDSIPSVVGTWKKRLYLPCQVTSIHLTNGALAQAGLSEKSEHLRGIWTFIISIYYKFWCYFHTTAHLSQCKRMRSFLQLRAMENGKSQNW